MSLRPYLALIALAGSIAGASVAARAESSSYPLPTAPPGATGQAPGAPTGQARPNRLRAALAQLGLSPAQHSQILSMITSYRAARGTSTPITRKQLLANIEGILTPDQQRRFQTLIRHRGPRPDPAAPATPAAT